jgi:hypothetical protein
VHLFVDLLLKLGECDFGSLEGLGGLLGPRAEADR